MNEAMQGQGNGDRKWKVVYTIVERPGQPEKKFWVRIGTAWVNRDQSMNVKLDASPTNGTLHIRDYEPYQEGRASRDEGQGELRAETHGDTRMQRPRPGEIAPLRAREGVL